MSLKGNRLFYISVLVFVLLPPDSVAQLSNATARATDSQSAHFNQKDLETTNSTELLTVSDTPFYWFPSNIVAAIEKPFKKPIQGRKVRVAILEYPDLMGQVTPLGRFLAEELITVLGKSGQCEIVERLALGIVIEENKLGLTGLIDPEALKKLGGILGVDYLIIGCITDLGKEFRMNLRVIDVQTAQIIVAPQWSFKREARSDYLWKRK